MRIVLPILTALFISFTFASPTLAAETTIKDFVGKWDLTIIGTNSSFNAGTIVVKNDGEAPSGELVWRFGSVHRNLKVSVNDAGELVVPRGKNEFRFKRHGSSIEGVRGEGKNAKVVAIGSRAINSINAAGTWDLTVELPDGNTATGVMKINSLGAGRYDASAVNQEGEEVEVSSVDVEGNQLKAKFLVQDGETTITIAAKILGDKLVGTASGGDNELPITGIRQRKFGPAVNMLADKGTAGWHARDSNRKFLWTCEDGVLANGDHDVDIVSDAMFDDFRVELEYRVDKLGSNSGMYIRGRYEVQILGNDVLNDHSNGAVYSRLKPKRNPFSGVGKWQKVEITIIDRYLTVRMNGEIVQDNEHLEGITGGALASREHEPGPLMLQGDHGRIFFRNIKVYPALD